MRVRGSQIQLQTETMNHQIIFLLTLSSSVFAIDERIFQEDFNGTSAVLLSVAYLQQATVFSDDNGMLRRIAYVETRDGARPNENIWAVSQEALQLTQISDHPTLNIKHYLISQEFDIDWISVEYDELSGHSTLYSQLVCYCSWLQRDSQIPVILRAKRNSGNNTTTEMGLLVNSLELHMS